LPQLIHATDKSLDGEWEVTAVASTRRGDRDTVASLPLHLIERPVGRREQGVGIDAIFGRRGDANRDARGQALVAIAHLERVAAHRGTEPLGDLAGALRGRVRQQGDQLVTRITSGQVVGAQVLPQ
jgi:hypothetical protein